MMIRGFYVEYNFFATGDRIAQLEKGSTACSLIRRGTRACRTVRPKRSTKRSARKCFEKSAKVNTGLDILRIRVTRYEVTQENQKEIKNNVQLGSGLGRTGSSVTRRIARKGISFLLLLVLSLLLLLLVRFSCLLFRLLFIGGNS